MNIVRRRVGGPALFVERKRLGQGGPRIRRSVPLRRLYRRQVVPALGAVRHLARQRHQCRLQLFLFAEVVEELGGHQQVGRVD